MKPKPGQFGSSRTLLGGEPDVNRRSLLRYKADEDFVKLVTFNEKMREWTPEQNRLLIVAIEALNKLNDLDLQ